MTNPKRAHAEAREIQEPWFRAQALAWVARFTVDNPLGVASEAASAARECENDYKKSAVRAWEIAALAEQGFKAQARESLSDALALGRCVEPKSSRSEVLFLLLQAAFWISHDEAQRVFEVLKASCPIEEHWRCRRAERNGRRILSGELEPRMFFWQHKTNPALGALPRCNPTLPPDP
jgi:hypothetical protein